MNGPNNSDPKLASQLVAEITTKHKDSQFGKPVCVSELGEVLEAKEGLRRFLSSHDYTPAEFAEMTGVSWRAVYSWLSGERRVPTAVLNFLGDILQDERKSVIARRLPRIPRKHGSVLRARPGEDHRCQNTTSIAAEIGEGVCAELVYWKTNNARIAANREIIPRQHLHGSIDPTKTFTLPDYLLERRGRSPAMLPAVDWTDAHASNAIWRPKLQEARQKSKLAIVNWPPGVHLRSGDGVRH